MNIDITTLFVCIDDFCKLYNSAMTSRLLPPPSGTRNRDGFLSLSEMLTIEIMFHFSPYKDFKHYYIYGIQHEQRSNFGKLPHYQRFVALKKQLFLPLSILLYNITGEKSGIYFADSTSLKVCNNKRISRHKTFKDLASRGKTTMGWFFGFKLHMVINHKGQIMAIKITAGNTDDRSLLESIVKNLKGKCYADKGYIGKDIFKKLWQQGLHLVTGIRSNMKNHLMPHIDKLLLRKRFLIETVFGVLKTDMNLDHSRHRSPVNAFVNILGCLTAYCYKNNKPAIKAFLIAA